MPTCRLCLRNYKKIRYQSRDIAICGHCVNRINENDEPAYLAQGRLNQKLLRQMLRPIDRDRKSGDTQRIQRADEAAKTFTQRYQSNLPIWLNKVLSNKNNNSIDHMRVRAYRRGMLKFEQQQQWEYPKNWSRRAARIRRRDKYQCQGCGAKDTTLDVHHIIYLSKHGTNQQSNLITLCRTCHEKEHHRIFDWAEAQEPGSKHPIQPSQNHKELQASFDSFDAPSKNTTPSIEEELQILMTQARHRWPYLTTVPHGLIAVREMIKVRDRLLSQGHSPTDALRTAINQIAPARAPTN